VRTRTIASTWRSCDHPSGVAVDRKRGFVFVACIDHVIVLDSTHSGREVGSLAAGAGLDNIDYSDDLGLLYAAAADAAKLTIARVEDHGKPTAVTVVPTTQRPIAWLPAPRDAYLIDPIGGSILKVEPN
jgi:DNA-binding beta-propeller fold protein YncE